MCASTQVYISEKERESEREREKSRKSMRNREREIEREREREREKKQLAPWAMLVLFSLAAYTHTVLGKLPSFRHNGNKKTANNEKRYLLANRYMRSRRASVIMVVTLNMVFRFVSLQELTIWPTSYASRPLMLFIKVLIFRSYLVGF